MGAHLGSELVREWRESTFYLDDWNLHRQKAMCRVRGWEQMMRWVPKIGEVYSRILYTYKWFHAEIRTCYFLLFGRQVFHCDWGGRGAQGLLSAGNSPQLKLARFDIWQILMNQLWTFYFHVHWNGWLYSPRLFFFEGFLGPIFFFDHNGPIIPCTCQDPGVARFLGWRHQAPVFFLSKFSSMVTRWHSFQYTTRSLWRPVPSHLFFGGLYHVFLMTGGYIYWLSLVFFYMHACMYMYLYVRECMYM